LDSPFVAAIGASKWKQEQDQMLELSLL